MEKMLLFSRLEKWLLYAYLTEQKFILQVGELHPTLWFG